MTSMTPNPDQNAVQSPVQDSAPQQGGATQQSGAQRSARSLMNSLYRSPRARKNGTSDAEDTVPLAIAAEVTPAEIPAEEAEARQSVPTGQSVSTDQPAASHPESNGWADWHQQPDWNEVTTGRSGSRPISPAPLAVPVGACRRACCFWWRCWRWLPWCGV